MYLFFAYDYIEANLYLIFCRYFRNIYRNNSAQLQVFTPINYLSYAQYIAVDTTDEPPTSCKHLRGLQNT